MLWIALELPALPLQIVERAGVVHEPLVVGEGPAQRPLVACANEAARAAGIREGQAVAAAKALAGELRVVPRDPATEEATLERLAAWAGQFTPMSCLDGQGIVMEVESCLRLFDGHAKLSAAIARGVRTLGFHATLGVAPTPLAARLFARAEAQGRAVRSCLTADELPERVAELPLFLLEWPAKTLARLTDLGVLRVRDMLELPAEGVARRFGPGIALSLDRLMGRVADPRQPYEPPPRFRARLELPAEADGVEALLFPLRRMLAEMEGVLRGRGAGVQRLALTLEHGRRVRTRLDLEFASPEREADFVLAIARERLGRLTLPAATCAIEVRAEALLPYAPRAGTWLPGARELAVDRERLVERLSARLGRERVFGIAIANDHRPEKDWARQVIPGAAAASAVIPGAAAASAVIPGAAAAAMARDPIDKMGPRPIGATAPAGATAHTTAPAGATAHTTAPAGATAKAMPAGATAPPTRPAWLLNRPQRLITCDGTPTCQGELTLHAGPERIESGWWDGEEVRRDYYVALNPRGEAFWIFREHRDLASWYLHGVFA